MAQKTDINNNPRAVLELAKKIGLSIQTLDKANEDISQKLQIFQSTIDEKGFETVNSYVKNAKKKSAEAKPAIQHTMTKLMELARLLQNMR